MWTLIAVILVVGIAIGIMVTAFYALLYAIYPSDRRHELLQPMQDWAARWKKRLTSIHGPS